MKIAILLNNLKIGGAQTLTIGIAEEWVKKGVEVEFIVTQEKGSLVKLLEKLNIKYTYINFWSYENFPNYFNELIKYINKNEYDAIFLNYSKYGQIISPNISDKTKIFTVVHGIDDNCLLQASINSQYIDKYIAISPKIEDLIKLNICNNIKLIPNGISNKINEFPKKMNKDKKRIVYSGRISHHDKGVLLLPEIYKLINRKIENTELIIIGEGPDLGRLKELINELNLTNDVIMTGRLSNNKVLEILSESDILLAPSYTEGFGLSIVEALSVGCVPVASKIEKVTDYIIQHGIDGILVEPGEVNVFVNEVIKLLEDDKVYEKISENGIQKSKQFMLNQTAAQWKSLIDCPLENKLIKKFDNNFLELPQVIQHLSSSTSENVFNQKREWLTNYYIHKKSNLTISKEKRIVIFGTLEQAYHIFVDAVSLGVNIVAFVDNNSGVDSLISYPVWKTEELMNNLHLYDVVIISKESDSKELISVLQNDLKDKRIIDWKYFVN